MRKTTHAGIQAASRMRDKSEKHLMRIEDARQRLHLVLMAYDDTPAMYGAVRSRLFDAIDVTAELTGMKHLFTLNTIPEGILKELGLAGFTVEKTALVTKIIW